MILPMKTRPLLSRIAVFFLISLTCPMVSQGQGQGRIAEALFHRSDKDGNGIVTEEELPDKATRARFDVDGDGEVTLEEFRAKTAENGAAERGQNEMGRLEEFLAAADTNQDGKITRDEAGDPRWFNRIDENKDDVIDESEVERVRFFLGAIAQRLSPTAPAVPITEEDMAAVTSGPEILKPGEVGIGRRVPDFPVQGIDGESHRLSEVKDYRGVVIAMTSATCPVSKRFLPTLAELEPKLAEAGIPLVLVNPFVSESEEQIREQLSAHSFEAPYVHDRDHAVSLALKAETTTEVFLIDSKQTLVYRGALNDQYGIDYSVEEPRVHYLEEAVEALVAGRSPEIAATAAPGCELNLKAAVEVPTEVTDLTYHRDISRILQQNCVECHREEGIAPFALDDFLEVGDRSRVIQRVVEEGTMPPWFAREEEGGSRWANDRALSDRDKADLLAWLKSPDQPEGDPAEAPAPLSFASEWSIGEPDLVLPLSKEFKIKAAGTMPYQYDVVETELTEDRWVSAYEILPTSRDVVHHVIVQLIAGDSGDRAGRVRDGGFWAAYVPGNGAVSYPEGFARKLPAGSKIRFQIHYTPSGRETVDRLKLGLVFADEEPRYEVKNMGIADRQLKIPAGAPAHQEDASKTLAFDTPVMSFMPHMHTRGKAFTYEVDYPDGNSEVLLDIPRYDFNWQLRYDLKAPLLLPKGSKIKVTGVYDNSAANKANPDPSRTVRWGDQTDEEMLIGYVEYFVPVTKKEVEVAAAESE